MTLAATALIAATPLLLHAETQTTKVDDQQITEQVKQKLAMNDSTVAPHILVTTRDGVVTLMGTQVPKGDILTATQDAENVDGVVRVPQSCGGGMTGASPAPPLPARSIDASGSWHYVER